MPVDGLTGRRLLNPGAPTKALYRKLDNLVRAILRRAILDPGVAALFASDNSLSTAFPSYPNGNPDD